MLKGDPAWLICVYVGAIALIAWIVEQVIKSMWRRWGPRRMAEVRLICTLESARSFGEQASACGLSLEEFLSRAIISHVDPQTAAEAPQDPNLVTFHFVGTSLGSLDELVDCTGHSRGEVVASALALLSQCLRHEEEGMRIALLTFVPGKTPTGCAYDQDDLKSIQLIAVPLSGAVPAPKPEA